ncbi:unnamed protein product [Calicophoron daubneyi]|uniref:Cytosolic Fe-S cluster assembly factor NUBP1 homolog n=1 Tax=Calicophoron daubneyi TaxID=300641 RepID=A0AAV2TZP4_CALDB
MADNIPPDAPAHCPGVNSESAGKAGACEGCPMQAACSSGRAKLPLSEREPEAIMAIRQRLGGIRYRILVLSGKGGVGKSSLSVCLARGISRRKCTRKNREDLFRVGLLDLDLCGPSTPCMLGCIQEKVHQSQSGWSPVFITENLSVMSIGFLLPDPDQAIVWRGPRKNALIRQLLTNVCWNEQTPRDSAGNEENLDFLIVDTPPGTSDEHLSAVQYLQAAGCLDGVLIVTTPQEVALSDVRKEISFCQKVSVPVLGIVENMTEFICPCCGQANPVFPPTTGGAASLCVPGPDGDTPELLGQLPLDPRLTRALDEGLCPFELAEENAITEGQKSETEITLQSSDPIMIAYENLIDRLLRKLQLRSPAVSRDVDMETGEVRTT